MEDGNSPGSVGSPPEANEKGKGEWKGVKGYKRKIGEVEKKGKEKKGESAATQTGQKKGPASEFIAITGISGSNQSQDKGKREKEKRGWIRGGRGKKGRTRYHR